MCARTDPPRVTGEDRVVGLDQTDEGQIRAFSRSPTRARTHARPFETPGQRWVGFATPRHWSPAASGTGRWPARRSSRASPCGRTSAARDWARRHGEADPARRSGRTASAPRDVLRQRGGAADLPRARLRRGPRVVEPPPRCPRDRGRALTPLPQHLSATQPHEDVCRWAQRAQRHTPCWWGRRRVPSTARGSRRPPLLPSHRRWAPERR